MEFLNIKPERIYYLSILAQCKNYQSAAEVLCLTEQALRYNIKALEQELESVLIEHSETGLQLNAMGKKALELGMTFISQLEQTLAQLTSPLASEQHFQLACAYAFEPIYIADYLDRLRLKFPQQQISVRSMYDVRVEQSVSEGQFDMGFLVEAPQSNRLKFVSGPQFPGVFVKRQQGEIQNYYLLPKIWTYDVKPHAEYPEFALPYPIRYIAQARLLLQLCLSGAGIAYLPLLKVLPYLKDQTLEIVPGPFFDFEHHLHLIWSSESELTTYQKHFIESVQKHWLELIPDIQHVLEGLPG